MKIIFLFTLAIQASAQQPQYGLILKGGHVIDPKNGVNAVRDVAISGGKIAALGANLPSAAAKKTINVSGLYVTPGLVDIHVHVFWGTKQSVITNGDHSVHPDVTGFRT